MNRLTIWPALPAREAAGAFLLAAALGLAPAAESAPASTNPAPAKDALEFSSGDKLRGTLVSFDSAGGVRWQHPAVRGIFTVQPTGLARVRVERPRPTDQGGFDCVVTVVNGDELSGQLAGLEEGRLTLQTWYAGTLQLARPAIRSVWLSFGTNQLLYEGPTSLEGWTTNLIEAPASAGVVLGGAVAQPAPADAPKPGGWEYKDGAFVTSGRSALARDFKLPPESKVEFDLQWQGYPAFNVLLYADSVTQSTSNHCYALHFQAQQTYLSRRKKGESSVPLGYFQAPGLDASAGRGHFSIRTSLSQQTMALFLDDKPVAKWNNIGELATEGTALMFCQTASSQVRLSNLRVSRWQGNAEDMPDGAEMAQGKEDQLQLANRDKLSGQLVAIKAGLVQFKTPFTAMDIPLPKVRRIVLAAASAPAPALEPKPVRLYFYNRGTLTLQLEHWDDQVATGHSPFLGEVKLVASAFKTIEFDLSTPRPANPAPTETTAPAQRTWFLQ